jgi:hypothetical protein
LDNKECSICKESFPLSNFYKAAKTPDKLQYNCIPCTKSTVKRSYEANRQRVIDKSARWRKNNPERVQEIGYEARLKKNFGMTLEGYNQILQSQNGKCLICGSSGRGGRSKRFQLFVDHCHKTGKVRGLLCMKCNSAIGYFDEDIARMKSAISYIERNF